MRPSTTLALFLIIFGLVSSAFTSLGMFDTTIPGQTVQFDDSQVTEITEGMNPVNLDEFSQLSMVLNIGRVLFFGVISALTIIPLMLDLGIPIEIAMIFQTPIWFVYIADRLGWLKGVEV